MKLNIPKLVKELKENKKILINSASLSSDMKSLYDFYRESSYDCVPDKIKPLLSGEFNPIKFGITYFESLLGGDLKLKVEPVNSSTKLIEFHAL